MARQGFKNIISFKTIDSTNRYLLDQATRGAPEGTVVVSEHQTSGRGRLDRRWEAEPGTCLLASVLVRPVISQVDLHFCTTAIALSALDGCRAVCGVEPAIKWPNDLVVRDRKLAGILAESDPTAPGGKNGSIAVVIGMGLNVSWPGPPEAGGTSVLAEMKDNDGSGDEILESATGEITRQLLDALLDAFEPRVVKLQTPAGRNSLLQEHRANCVTLGRRVRVELANGFVEGDAVGISDSGCLVVESSGRRIEVASGDVVHVRPS